VLAADTIPHPLKAPLAYPFRDRSTLHGFLMPPKPSPQTPLPKWERGFRQPDIPFSLDGRRGRGRG